VKLNDKSIHQGQQFVIARHSDTGMNFLIFSDSQAHAYHVIKILEKIFDPFLSCGGLWMLSSVSFGGFSSDLRTRK
jgi:hypothetical protein